MDTKLKNSNAGKTWFGITFALEVAVLCGTAFVASIFVAVGNMRWHDVATGFSPEWYHAAEILKPDKLASMLEGTGIASILAGLAALVLLILLMVMVGRFSKDEEGKIKFNWFDRIWSEVQLFVGIAAGTGCAAVLVGLYDTWCSGAYFGIWRLVNENEAYFYITEDVQMTFFAVALIVCVIVALTCFLSLIKKIKAKYFWEHSLIGGICLRVCRSIKTSDRVTLKVMGLLIIVAVLSATWVGLPVMLALIIIFVPKLTKKFIEIKNGVSEVKNGNLTYKIPVETDAKGVMGELDRLASDINNISEASNIAVQNELKNQRMKTELISNVSHDLKTPLTSMISYVDLMKTEGLDSPNAPGYLDIIEQKTQRLKVLTENLFDAAKASSGAIPVNIESIDLASLLTQSLVEMEERLALKNLDIRVQNECEESKILADGQLMWRVLENLLGNISKYALENSRVYIDMKDVGESNINGRKMILLEVKNISKDQLNISADELTERFKRGDESRNTEGSGLGLAIAKDLVKLMNGVFEITIDGDLFKASVLMEKAE